MGAQVLTGLRAFATPVEEICESLGGFGSPVPLQVPLLLSLLAVTFHSLQFTFAHVCCEQLVRIRRGSQPYNPLPYWSKRVYR